MKYDLLQLRAKRYKPAGELDALMGVVHRRQVRGALALSALLLAVYALAVRFAPTFLGSFGVVQALPSTEGGALLFAACYLASLLFELFYNSYYFEEVSAHTPPEGVLSFELAAIINASQSDIVLAFAQSNPGREILLRAGMSPESIGVFVASRVQVSRVETSGEAGAPERAPRISEFVTWLIANDKPFADALFAAGVKEEDVLGASDWYERRMLAYKRSARFWSKESLSHTPSIGRDWSYGQAYMLEKFSVRMQERREYYTTDAQSPRGAAEMQQLETILSRSAGANAILVGSEGSGVMEIIARLAHGMYDGSVQPSLTSKEVVVFEGEAMVASMGNKLNFEQGLLQLFNQSNNAGNIILVVPNFAAFMESARTIGSDVLSLIEPYLSSSQLHIILIVEPDPFYRTIEGNPQVMSHFETVKIEVMDGQGTVHLLEEIALSEEYRNGILFTYPALVEVASSATRYFPGGVMPDKAIDLLREIAPAAHQQKRYIITKQDVLDLVGAKTGIPLGEVSEDEKEKLLKLESILHERVIGQDEAVKSVAEAMRRARAGIRNQDRPMGLFLFLGATGVGKTETAKALSDLFFGEKHPMLRLDMTEYSGADAVDKLIGSFETNRAGTLALMLKETPYGVLLLDEFEKCAQEVKDLFLQVFDEGMFSDKSGKNINARNVIIIATSNAGSQLIWDYFKAGEDVSAHKKELVDYVISNNLFKPELINRFDGVVVFHPLNEASLQSIAKLMLGKFAERLRREKGIALTVTDALVSYMMQFGVDPQFGARPMNRAIQDTVERVIAEKIIKGELSPGSIIELTAADLGPTGTSA